MGIPTEGLVLYLPLNSADMQGSPIISKDIYAHSCTVTNGTWGSTGRTFVGTGKIDCGNKTQFQFEHNTPFSILAWFKPSDITTYGAIASKIGLPATWRGYQLLQTNAGKLVCDLVNNNGTGKVANRISNAAITQDVFQLLGFTHSGSGTAAGLIQYRNGAVFASTAGTDALGGLTIANSVPFLVGNRANNDIPAKGIIGEVWDYNRALPSTEIEAIFNETVRNYKTCWDFFSWA